MYQKQDSTCLVKAYYEMIKRIYLALQIEISALEKDRAKRYQTNIQKLLNLLGFVLTPQRKKKMADLIENSEKSICQKISSI